jgi:hypothetical protein
MVILKSGMRGKLSLPPLRTCIGGVQNIQDHHLRLHCTGEPAWDSRTNVADSATRAKFTRITRAFHNAIKAHNKPHILERISARTYQSHPKSWAGTTKLARNRIRTCSTQAQHMHSGTGTDRREARDISRLHATRYTTRGAKCAFSTSRTRNRQRSWVQGQGIASV